jgi:hypothetical protein
MVFRNFLEMSSLRDLLGNIPQNPKHPEGDVFTHTRRGLVDNGVTALQAFDATAKERQKKAIAGGGQSAAPNSPIEFVKSLAGKPLPVIRIAFQGKFGRPPTEEELI